jgi:hypothetical protein
MIIKRRILLILNVAVKFNQIPLKLLGTTITDNSETAVYIFNAFFNRRISRSIFFYAAAILFIFFYLIVSIKNPISRLYTTAIVIAHEANKIRNFIHFYLLYSCLCFT